MNGNTSASPDIFPPNPITKWFSVKKLVASAGPEFAWKVYDAVRVEDYKICSVFLFEKYIADKLHKPRRRDIVTNMLKREVKILCQLKHCYLLRVVHPIEENGDTLAFATEPVFASLANLLGNHTRLPTPVSPEIQKFRFTDLNRKLGIYQITEVLRFLHLGHSVFHNNICPGAILVTRSGQWRLASVSFLEAIKMDKKDNRSSSVLNPPGSTGKGRTLSLDLSASPWSRKLPKMARPDPHFAAPECLSLTTGWSAPFTSRWSRPSPEGQDVPFHEESGHDQPNKNKTRGSDIGSQGTTMNSASNHPGPWSDMFSLGLIICAVYKVGESAQTSYESQRPKRVREKPLAHITSAEEVENTTNLTGETTVEFSAEASRVEQLSTDSSIPEAFRTAVTRMPMGLVEPVEKMLSRSCQKRPSSQLFSLLKFFNDPSMLCLDVLLNFEEKAFEDRVRALQNIQHNVDRFSKELLLYRFLPMILDLLEKYHRRVTVHPNQTGKHKDDDLNRRGSLYRSDALQASSNQDDRDVELIRKLMAALACIVQKSSPADYNEYIEQYVNDFVRRCKRVEIKAEILHNITAFTKHASVQSIEQLLVPILCDCLASHIPEVQVSAV
ncbi:SCY1 protein 2 [Fasciola gigantica]|uniref:SCY1 protein 2 n=1 Tax=Fasciola gigantica TaxID=46835 RepID=A0A504Z0C7_FASGI|nr:SCY1 protein 2 [Fasciola gigantica]